MTIAIIGGSGLDQLSCFSGGDIISQSTPYGDHSNTVMSSCFSGCSSPVFFLPRHGSDHQLPPHTVNYRANLWLLKSLGVEKIIACNVVGGINASMPPGTLVLPDQIIDYTWGRQHTFFDGENTSIKFTDQTQKTLPSIPSTIEHIDFTFPYSTALRQELVAFLTKRTTPFFEGGVYGCTQGPRLETAAEIQKLKGDGCDLVGMTAMPEAALARELNMQYVGLSLVVNWAPGMSKEELSIEKIMSTIQSEMKKVCDLMPELINFLR